MRKIMVAFLAAGFVGGCGVNPDRLATMQKRNSDMAEQGEGEEAPTILEYSDSDPKGIRDAVMAVNDMETKLGVSDFQGYMTRRYEAVVFIDLQASPEVSSHPKAPLIKKAIHEHDLRFAKLGGERAVKFLGVETRSSSASADALYSLQDAFETCERAVLSTDAQASDDLYRKYEASLDRAIKLDGNSTEYLGKRPDGTGVIDVAAEIGYCEARMAAKRIDAEDQPAKPQDLSKAYTGCGYYAVQIEAAETVSNRFGAYQVASVYAQDPDPGAATKVDCGAIPPASDAPTPVQRGVKDGVAWLADTDILSMEGPFEYEPRDSGLHKKGTVRVYRKEASLKSSRCGVEDGNATCEAEGSDIARAYNHATHYLKRATFHRKAGRAERCKAMADQAYRALNSLVATDEEKSYITADGGNMSKSEIMSRIESLKSQANDVLASDWCTKP